MTAPSAYPTYPATRLTLADCPTCGGEGLLCATVWSVEPVSACQTCKATGFVVVEGKSEASAK